MTQNGSIDPEKYESQLKRIHEKCGDDERLEHLVRMFLCHWIKFAALHKEEAGKEIILGYMCHYEWRTRLERPLCEGRNSESNETNPDGLSARLKRWWKRCWNLTLVGLSFRSLPIEVELGDIGSVASYHLSFKAPSGVLLSRIKLPPSPSSERTTQDTLVASVLHARGHYGPRQHETTAKIDVVNEPYGMLAGLIGAALLSTVLVALIVGFPVGPHWDVASAIKKPPSDMRPTLVSIILFATSAFFAYVSYPGGEDRFAGPCPAPSAWHSLSWQSA
ncbi:MAG: hypothetical protein QG622_3129 [Actinomycetota bacterium]|nr:hypothetical protein [Actinomycetota bacterium]